MTGIKRWPISQKRRTKTYKAINDAVMNARIDVNCSKGALSMRAVDNILINLKRDIWREVSAALGVPS